MIPAVAYIRMSSDKQEASPHQQRDEIEQLASRDGYRIIRWYSDEGISGDATDKRLGFQRMIEDADRKDFEAILCWDMDRFGRFDSIEAGRWIYPLRQNGVYLVTVAQGKIDWSDFASRMLYGIQQEGKHAYLRDLSRNVCRGLREKANQGKWPSGVPPFGYIIGVDGKLALGDESHVRTVQHVFQQYLAGYSMRAIVEQMRAANRPAPGREWTRDALRGILTNAGYTGDFYWGIRSSGKYHRGTDEPIHFPNNHPAIIDHDTFNAVQRRRCEQRGGKTPKRNGGTFVLSGLVRCSECGERMHGRHTRGHNYIICGSHARKGLDHCDAYTVREDVVVGYIIDAIEREFLNPELIQRIREELRRQIRDGQQLADEAELKKQLARLEKELDVARHNMVLADPGLLPEYETIFRELRSRQTLLKAEIKTAQGRSERQADETVDKAVALLSTLRTTCEKADPVRLREFLRQAVEKVVLRVGKTLVARRHRFHLLGGDVYIRLNNLGVTAG